MVLYCYGKINETAQTMKTKLHMDFAIDDPQVNLKLSLNSDNRKL